MVIGKASSRELVPHIGRSWEGAVSVELNSYKWNTMRIMGVSYCDGSWILACGIKGCISTEHFSM